MYDRKESSYITIAIEYIEDVRKLAIDKKQFDQSYRSRARRIPSLIYEIGLLSTICYLYAKATNNVYEKVLNANQITDLRDSSNEELAHALYLKHILSYIACNMDRYRQEKDPTKFIMELSKNPNDIMVAESLLKPFLIELKHLAEAVLEVEE